MAKTVRTCGLYHFPLVYNPYHRQVAGKIFLSIGQFAFEASLGYNTDTPSVLFWAGKRLSQLLAKTCQKLSSALYKAGGIVVSLSRILLFSGFPQTVITYHTRRKDMEKKRANLINIQIYVFALQSEVLKRTIPFLMFQPVSTAYLEGISPTGIISFHLRMWLTTS